MLHDARHQAPPIRQLQFELQSDALDISGELLIISRKIIHQPHHQPTVVVTDKEGTDTYRNTDCVMQISTLKQLIETLNTKTVKWPLGARLGSGVAPDPWPPCGAAFAHNI